MIRNLEQILPEPVLVWGLFTRAIALLYFIALVQLIPQVMGLAGSKGINPVSGKIDQIKRDYPGWRKYILFPSLLHLNSSDKFIKGILITGCLASLWSIYGGPFAGLGLVIAWLCYLSMDLPVGLSYPWDCLLFEMGFLSFLLPALHSLPQLASIQAPHEVVAWAYRLLLFRVVFGFGKFKFSSLNLKDSGYFKAFMVNIPLPGQGAWYLYRMPECFFRSILILAFFIEIIAPPFLFVTAETRLIAGILIVLLMAGIWVISSFGYFNLATIILCLPLLDCYSSLFNLHLAGLILSPQAFLTTSVIVVLSVGWAFAFVFNSWCTFTWLHWPSALQVRSGIIRGLLSFYRILQGFRLIHSYGVFPPKSSPPIKWSPVFEGSDDNLNWAPFEYKYFTSTEFSAPRIVAPYHPRLDHAVFYEAFGTNGSSFLSSMVGTGDPYGFTYAIATELIMQRLLEGNKLVYSLFGKTPYSSKKPPRYVRIAFYSFQPTDNKQRGTTGKWWTQEFVSIHRPSTTLNPVIEQKTKSQPELFHWDAVFWRNWSPAIKSLLKTTESQSAEAIIESIDEFLHEGTAGFFWNTWHPKIHTSPVNWNSLSDKMRELEETYGFEILKDAEIYWSRLSIIMGERLLFLFLNKEKNSLNIDNYFIYGLFIHHIIAKDKDVVLDILDNPSKAIPHRKDFSQENAFYSYAAFRCDALIFLSNKLRLTMRFSTDTVQNDTLPGFSRLIPFVSTLFKNRLVENYPELKCDSINGRWYINRKAS